MKTMAQKSAEADELPIIELSERELEILRLIARGYTNKVISEQLNLSNNTIKYHNKNILQKLNAHNRTEAVITAIRKGLIDRE